MDDYDFEGALKVFKEWQRGEITGECFVLSMDETIQFALAFTQKALSGEVSDGMKVKGLRAMVQAIHETPISNKEAQFYREMQTNKSSDAAYQAMTHAMIEETKKELE